MIESLHIYPIKSLPGLSVQTMILTQRGPQFDRRFMLIDDAGRFITQRQNPQMALFDLSWSVDDTFVVGHGSASIPLPFAPTDGDALKVMIWEDECIAWHISKTADEFFSDAIKTACRLVYMPETTQRAVDQRFAPGNITSFSDGYPYLILGTASLKDLTDRWGENADVRRFRPNIVLATEQPFEEDQWGETTLQGNTFSLVKPCGRCVLINVHPDTGETGKEPLRTLSTYRSKDHKVLFGQNAVWLEGDGVLKVNAKS